MTLTEAKQLVRRFPKRVGPYRRNRLTNLNAITTVNWMLYQGLGNCNAASIGDGNIYGLKLQSSDGGKVFTPDLGKVLLDASWYASNVR